MNTEELISKMIHYFGTDVHQVNHALKVYAFAATISRLENLSAKTIQCIEATAILHDVGIPVALQKYKSSSGKYQEMEGPAIAGPILESINLDQESIHRICFIISKHHSYNEIDGIDFQILVEADFLVNIYENNMDSTSIDSIRKKYFKTKAGIGIFDKLYSKNKN